MHSIMKKSIVAAVQLAFVIAALLYLVSKSLLDPTDTIDFKSIWLAGRFWHEGRNPYTEDYVLAGEALFVGMNRPDGWFYPPNWWPIATAFSSFDYAFAGRLWRAVNGLLVVVGCIVLLSGMKDARINAFRWMAVFVLVYTSTMSATAFSLSLGQTSIIIFFAFCIFVRAWLRKERFLMGVALILLALKPPIGLVLAGFLMPTKFWWRSLAGAGVVVGVFSLPPFWLHGWDGVISLMLTRLNEYGSFAVNAAPSTTGLRSVLFFAADISVSAMHLTAVALLISICLGWLVSYIDFARNDVVPLAAVISVGIALVPMHTYDALLLVPIVLAILAVPLITRILLALCLVIVWRLNNFSEFFGLIAPGETYFSGTLLLSVVAFLLATTLSLLVVLGAVADHNSRSTKA